MSNIELEREFLAGPAEAEDALTAAAAWGNPGPAANVVRVMVNQLGKDEATIPSKEIRMERQAVIFEIARELDITPALQELHARPLPKYGRQILQSSGHGTESDKAQTAIVEFLDQVSVQQ